MNVYDFAMKMEEDGKGYYEQMARDASHPGLKTIFTRLAQDEQKHFETFQQMKMGNAAVSMPDTTILEDAKNIFEELPTGGDALKDIQGDLKAYRHAMRLEADSFRLYEETADKESNQQVKALLLKIAAEEHKHFNILDNIYQFVNAPNQYLAWGEFSNLDEFRQFGRETDK